MSFAPPPNIPDYLTFIREGVGIGPAYLPDDSLWVETTFDMAIATVDLWLQIADCTGLMYVLACYNYAADRLLNFATDLPGQCYFRDQRAALGLNSFTPGIVTASADQGTSQALQLIDAMKGMTISDLQLMRTPYGLNYLTLAQNYGSNIWGLTR